MASVSSSDDTQETMEASQEAPPSLPAERSPRQRIGTMDKKWKDQIKKDKTIYKHLSEFVEKRRKMYDDLDDLLEKKARVCSLSTATLKEKKTSVVTEPDSPHTKHEFVRKAFIKHDEVQQAIEVALETSCRVHGSQEGVTRKEILEFVQKKFDLTWKQIEAVEERASQQPQLQLMCKVIRATDLKVKSGNGSHQRNPYCRVGILNQKHYQPSSDFKFLSEWQKVGELDDVKETAFKTGTLKPIWNEDLLLTVGNIEEDVVVIEVWDHPPSEGASKKRKTKSFKGLGAHSKEHFIGWMFHPLLLVPIAGAELKFTLMSRSKKPLNGFITLFLSIQGNTEEKALQTRLNDHHVLTRALIDDYSKDEDGERNLEWSGELGTESERLLEYHGVLNGLNKLQIASVHFSELFRYHKYETDSVDLKAFIDVIKRMKQLEVLFPGQGANDTSLDATSIGSDGSSSKPSDTFEEIDSVWVDRLFSDLQLLEADLMDTMNDHIRLVNFGFGGDPESIYPHLSLLLELYTFKPFTDQMKPKKELRRQLEKCIEPSVDSWFRMLKTTVMPTRGTEPKELRDLCVYCLTWSERVVEKLILNDTFTQADVDYFSLYLLSLDGQLSKEVSEGLKKYPTHNPDTITFEIYTHFQRLVEISENADEDIRAKLTILGFHKWFQEFVPGWIIVATDKCDSRIRQAIEIDEIIKITDELQMSASAVDTNGFLLQMATFWQHLDWPVASEAYGYAVSLVQNMCSSVNLFIDEVYSGLRPEDLHDEQGRFKVSEKLCLVLNNMFHVREHLSGMPKHMELEKLYNMLREEDEKKYSLAEEGGPDVGDMDFDPMMSLNVKAKSLFKELFESADEDIMNKINELVKKICQKILPDIKEYINQIIVSNDNDELVISSLFDYLMENLVTLGNNLLPPVFQNITATLWEVSVEAIAEVVNDSHKRHLSVYTQLRSTLNSLKDFYYCDGAGVSGTVLNSEAYSSLKSKLDILGMPTDQLIVLFYSDFLDHQQKQSKAEKFGELLVSAGFIKASSAIEVTVIHGENMEMISEPYIKLRLSSVCQASDKHWKTKSVKGMQKAPIFDEDIKLSVTEAEMNSEGSLVFFYLLDRKLRNRVPHGMCVLDCKKIPQLAAKSKSSIMEPIGPERKNFRLPLFRFTEETPCLKELAMRADKKDSVASNFLKINELLLTHLPHLNPHQRVKLGTLRKN